MIILHKTYGAFHVELDYKKRLNQRKTLKKICYIRFSMMVLSSTVVINGFMVQGGGFELV